MRALQFFLPLIVMLPVALNKNFEFKYVIYANQSTLRLETDEVSTGVSLPLLPPTYFVLLTVLLF